MNGGRRLLIDASSRLSFARPRLDLDDGMLHVGFPSRSSLVVLETLDAIRHLEREHVRRRSGGRRRRRERPSRSRRSTTEAQRRLLRAIESRRPEMIAANGTDGDDGVAAALAALMRFDGRDGAIAEESFTDLWRADWEKVTAFVRRHLEARALIAADPGTIVRTTLHQTTKPLLLAELRERVGDRVGALDQLHGAEPNTITAIRRASLLRQHGDHDAVVSETSDVRTIDDSTAYLCVMRGISASHIGRSDLAVASFGEAVRLQRTNERVKIRAVVERAAHHARHHHLGRAVVDLRRARTMTSDLDAVVGIDRAIRSLDQRRARR